MTPEPTSLNPAAVRRVRRRRAEALAQQQCGIVSRRQLYDLGMTRAEVRANVRADRWRAVGRQSVCIHRGPLSQEALHWAAVHEAGPRAYLDGGSALIAAGLKGFEMERIRVSVPRGARVWRAKGLDIRQTRRWDPEDLAPGGLRRSCVAVAAVRHGLWARSEREGAYALTASVQQGLTSAELIGRALLSVKRDKRRAYVEGVVVDMLGGVRSLGELDVLRECRRRELPPPSQQALRRATTACTTSTSSGSGGSSSWRWTGSSTAQAHLLRRGWMTSRDPSSRAARMTSGVDDAGAGGELGEH